MTPPPSLCRLNTGVLSRLISESICTMDFFLGGGGGQWVREKRQRHKRKRPNNNKDR